MRGLVTKFQKDMVKLQNTLQKEGNDLLEKVKHLELIDSIDHKRDELEKLLQAKIKKFEPAYNQFLADLKKNAKKAGIDISKIEREIKEKATLAKKTLKKKTKLGKTTKASSKKKIQNKMVSKKKTSAKKTAKKTSASKKASSTKKTSSKKKTK